MLHIISHFFKNVTLSCPTCGMLPRAACHWLTKSESASYWLTQSATYSILPPAQASCCSTLDMLSSYIVVQHMSSTCPAAVSRLSCSAQKSSNHSAVPVPVRLGSLGLLPRALAGWAGLVLGWWQSFVIKLSFDS